MRKRQNYRPQTNHNTRTDPEIFVVYVVVRGGRGVHVQLTNNSDSVFSTQLILQRGSIILFQQET